MAYDIGPRIGIEGEAQFKSALSAITAQTRALNAEMKNVQASFTAADTAESKLTKRTEVLKRQVTAAGKQVDLLRKQYSKQRAELEQLGKAVDDASKEYGENSEQADKARNAYNRQAAQLNRTATQLHNAEANLHTLNAELEKNTSKWALLGAKCEEIGTKMQAVGGKVKDAGRTLSTYVTAPILGVGAAAAKTATDFESGMLQVAATMGMTADEIGKTGSKTQQEYQKLSDAARKMGAETQFSATDAADALNYLALAGYDSDKAISTLPTVLNLAAAGNMDLAAASDMVTDAMSALGMESSQAGEFVDKMAVTAQKSNTSVAQLGEAILTVGGTAKGLAGGTTELNTALGILADNGIKGAEGGTALRNIILSLSAPTDKAAKQMQALGLQVYDAEGKMRPLNEIFNDLNGTLAGMTQGEQTKVLDTLFNKVDLKSANALLANSGARFDELSGYISKSDGAAAAMAKTLNSGLKGQLTTLKSQLQEAGIALGEALLPAAKSAVGVLQNLADGFNKLSPAAKAAVATAGAIAAAIGPLMFVVGTLIEKGGVVVQALPKLAPVAAKLGAAISGLSAPVLAVAAVIAVLAAAFTHLWKTNDGFRDAIISTWNEIQTAVSEFVTGISDRLSELGISFSDITNALGTAWNGFCEVLAPVFAAAFDIVAATLQTVLGVLTGLLDVFIGVFSGDWSQAWQGVQEVFAGVWAGISGTLSAALGAIQGMASVFFNWLSAGWESLRTKIATTVNAIKVVVTTTFTAIKTTASTIWNGIKTAISTVVDGVKAKVTTAFNSVRSTVSNVFNSIKSTASTTWNSIKNAITTPINNAKDAVKRAIDKMKSFFHFSWSLPRLKLPHVSVSGSFSLVPPSVPHFSISWYKNGGVLTRPTVFGAAGNTLLAGGEAGAEAVLPLSTLWEEMERRMMRTMRNLSSYNDASAGSVDVAGIVTATLNGLFDRLNDRDVTLQLVDGAGRVIARAIAPEMDAQLARLGALKVRGV